MVMEKFFSESYLACRERFLKAAEEAGCTDIRSLPVIDDLTTDVAIFHGNSDSYLLHISGTHGPEGYVGSATQLAILTLMKDEFRGTSTTSTTSIKPTIILIHALNPFGFHTGRRVNENNVDMNRNFLSPTLWNEVLTRDPNFAGYQTLDNTFNFTTMPTKNLFINDIWGYIKLIKTFLVYGITNAKRALVAGNYHKPTGLGFGGQELQTSAENIIKLVEELEIPTKAKRVGLIDVHSGLGPCGVDTLMYDLGIKSTIRADESGRSSSLQMDTIFPPEYAASVWTIIDLAPSIFFIPLYVVLFILGRIVELFLGKGRCRHFLGGMFSFVSGGLQDSVIGGQAAGSGYELTRGTVSGDFARSFLAPHLDDEHLITVTQEFGTVPVYRVGKTQTEENYAYHYGSETEKKIYSARNINIFYVRTDGWKRNVVRRGLAVFKQALSHLQKAS